MTDFGQNDSAQFIRHLSNGNILVAGRTALNVGVAQYKPDGKLDPTFGDSGVVSISLGPVDSGSSNLAGIDLLPDNKLLMWGGTYASGTSRAEITRLTASGQRDFGFGINGFSEYYQDRSNAISELRFQDDGGMIATLNLSLGYDGYSTKKVRYDVNGMIDRSFEHPSIDLHYQDAARAVQTLDDGSMLFYGRTGVDGLYSVKVTKVKPDGKIDTSFGTNGVTLIDFGGNDDFGGIFLLSDGSMLLSAITYRPNSSRLALARLNYDGSLNTEFGSGGMAVYLMDQVTGRAPIAMQADGRFLVAASNRSDNDLSTIVVYRFHPNGNIDPSFGTNGRVQVDVSDRDSAHALSILSDGSLLVAGTTETLYRSASFLLLKLTATGALDRNFGDH